MTRKETDKITTKNKPKRNYSKQNISEYIGIYLYVHKKTCFAKACTTITQKTGQIMIISKGK